MGWTLADIRNSVRQITGRRSISQISNADLDSYINNFVLYEFPEEIKTDKLRQFYNFVTDKDQQDYTYAGYTNVQPKIYIEGIEVDYYQDPNFYLSAVPEYFKRATVDTGDGVTVLFSDTLESFPLTPGAISFTDTVETFTDFDATGTLTGSLGGSGTINYVTGAWSITFNTAPLDQQSITASYLPYMAGMPTNALVFNDKIRFFPIPDSAYQVKVVAFKIPAMLSSAASTPELQEWGPLISVGASRQIFLDNGEVERLAEIEPMYREKKKLSMRRVAEAMNSERASPRF